VSFKANPQGIREFGEHVKRLDGDAERAGTYVQNWLSYWGAGGMLFQSVADAAGRVEHALLDNYRRLVDIAQQSGWELQSTASFYETTDLAAAELLDESYGPPRRTEGMTGRVQPN
jgi:hypothetical protein